MSSRASAPATSASASRSSACVSAPSPRLGGNQSRQVRGPYRPRRRSLARAARGSRPGARRGRSGAGLDGATSPGDRPRGQVDSDVDVDPDPEHDTPSRPRPGCPRPCGRRRGRRSGTSARLEPRQRDRVRHGSAATSVSSGKRSGETAGRSGPSRAGSSRRRVDPDPSEAPATFGLVLGDRDRSMGRVRRRAAAEWTASRSRSSTAGRSCRATAAGRPRARGVRHGAIE